MHKIISVMIIGILLLVCCSTSADLKNTKTEYDLVIVSPKEFIKSLQPLVGHKNSHEVKTLIKNVDEIYDEFEGRDEAEKVKYFIKYAKENYDIKYVLLVGGRKGQLPIETWWIPVRYSHIEYKNDRLSEMKFLSDLYFADIYNEDGSFSSWDSDNDNIFGEWPLNKTAEDIIDLKPDIYVGRLPCRNIFDVKIMVNKIKSYENGAYGKSWFNNTVAIAGDSFPKIPGSYEGEEYTQKGLEFMPDFNHIKLWTSDGSLKSWRDVVKAINNGCGFLWFSGAGTPGAWGTYLPNNPNYLLILTSIHIPFLINNKKLPICVTGGGCHNCDFNVSLSNFFWSKVPVFRCIGWSLTCKLFGGSIATIGPTSIVYETPMINSKKGGIEWLDINFFEEYGINHTDILGETWGKAIENFLEDLGEINWRDVSSNNDSLIVKNIEGWMLMGDPSLKIGGYQ